MATTYKRHQQTYKMQVWGKEAALKLSQSQVAFIADRYETHSISELAEMTNIPYWVVSEAFRFYNFRKTPEQRLKVHHRRRIEVTTRNLELRNKYAKGELFDIARKHHGAIGFCELPVLWDLHVKKVDKQVICNAFSISHSFYDECIIAYKMILVKKYGKVPSTPAKEIETIGDLPSPYKKKKSTPTVNTRPPAIYSNKSPYGVAIPGM